MTELEVEIIFVRRNIESNSDFIENSEHIIIVEDSTSASEILSEVEPLIEKIEDRDLGIVSIRVKARSGSSILNGTVKNGYFNGIKFS